MSVGPVGSSGWSRLARTAAVHATAMLALGAGLLVGTSGQPPAPPSATERLVDTQRVALVVPTRAGRRWKGHPDRRILRYRVRAGNTPSEIAKRFHAWTDELLAINGRSASGVFYAGERIRVPVVVSAARAHGHRVGARHRAGHKTRTHKSRSHQTRQHKTRTHKTRPHKSRPHKSRPHRDRTRGPRIRHGRHYHRVYSRATVRRIVVRTARRYDINPHLALAIAWQESGWQSGRIISSAGAVGPMQVMPDTGRWISSYVGRRLDLYRVQDNVIAGIALLRLLRRQVGIKVTIGSYYQGLGAMQQYGPYPDTRRYIANVLHFRSLLRRGWNPLR